MIILNQKKKLTWAGSEQVTEMIQKILLKHKHKT